MTLPLFVMYSRSIFCTLITNKAVSIYPSNSVSLTAMLFLKKTSLILYKIKSYITLTTTDLKLSSDDQTIQPVMEQRYKIHNYDFDIAYKPQPSYSLQAPSYNDPLKKYILK